MVVAHRLSTVQTADKIIAMREGRVVEAGTHDDLINLRGLYFSLVMAQVSKEEEEVEDRESQDHIQDLETGRLFLFFANFYIYIRCHLRNNRNLKKYLG